MAGEALQAKTCILEIVNKYHLIKEDEMSDNLPEWFHQSNIAWAIGGLIAEHKITRITLFNLTKQENEVILISGDYSLKGFN